MTVEELQKLLSNFDKKATVKLTVEGRYDYETARIEITSSINSVTLVIHEDFSVTTHPEKIVVAYWKGEKRYPYQGIGRGSKQFDTKEEAQRFITRMSNQAYFTEIIKV